MADYYAVLQRTLSGFTNPKPELRTKLYERARTTIQRQLESRTPPMEPESLAAELQKLEDSITKIEASYNQDLFVEAEEPTTADETLTETVTETDVPEEAPADPLPEPMPPIPVKQESELETPVETAEPVEEPTVSSVKPVSPESHAETETVPDMVPELDSVLAGAEEQSDPLPEIFDDVAPEETTATEPPPELPRVGDIPYAADLVAQPSEYPDGYDQGARSEDTIEDAYAAVAEAVAETSLADEPPIPISPSPVPIPTFPPATDPAAPEPTELPAFDPAAADDLTIPPAPGFGTPVKPKRRKGGFLKWVLTLLVVGGIGAAGYFGWQNKDDLIERFDLGQYINPDDPTRPKPVKTIPIAPPPTIEQEEATANQAEAEVAPKLEKRLTEDGTEVEPAVTLPPTTPAPATGVEPLTPAQETAPTPTGDGASQSAILYEKDNADGRSTDQGSVTWSVIQEEPAADQPKEPAIRGRVEIPSRNLILIMTIKRNTDKSFPATHLIELVFAVPDDFSGGSISQISRVVLKDTEQSRGESLLGVPAPIASGIFLFALNNLEEATKKNITLLRESEWIDIPLQYATGRSALITMEKGEDGKKAFQEALTAWESAT